MSVSDSKSTAAWPRLKILLVCALALTEFLLAPAAANAGAWTQPKGGFWIKAAYLYQFTRELYAPESATLPGGTRVNSGDLRPYDDAGAALQKTLLLEAEYGLSDRFTLGVQFPYNFLQFEDDFRVTKSWGFGDIRLLARGALLTGRQRLTIRAAWKPAGGKAATDPLDLPVSEGQTDFDLGLQWGMGLGRDLSWLGAEAGYRWRLEDDEGRIPGNEVFWRAEAGYGLVPAWGLAAKVGYAGLRAGRTYRGDLPEQGKRAVDTLEFALLWRFAPGFLLEPTISTTLSGEAFPAGEMYSLALHKNFSL